MLDIGPAICYIIFCINSNMEKELNKRLIIMTKSKKYGIYYRSHNKWTGPYVGLTFTKYMENRTPTKEDIKYIKNNILKTRIQIRAIA